MTYRRFAPLLLLSLGACTPRPAGEHYVGEWLRLSRGIAATQQLSPPVASRLAAYQSVALYEGLASGAGTSLRSVGSQVNGLWTLPRPQSTRALDGATVAAEAARIVVDSILGGSADARRLVDSLGRAQVARRRAEGVGRDQSERSVTHGGAIARAILAWADRDGFATTRGRPWPTPRTFGQWTPGPPSNAPGGGGVVLAGDPAGSQAMEPHWGRLRLFVLRTPDECVAGKLPPYSEQRSSDFWKMARALHDTLAALTPDKRAAASYWMRPEVFTGVWNSAAQSIARARRSSVEGAAEAQLLASLAIADAYVVVWREKYRALTVRPQSYLRRVINSSHQQFFPAASPEYPAEHAVVSAAAAGVLFALFGDSTAFVDSSAAGARAFTGLSPARAEISGASLYAGLQFVQSVEIGAAQGECIAERVTGRVRTRR